jgi:hypothetical protein
VGEQPFVKELLFCIQQYAEADKFFETALQKKVYNDWRKSLLVSTKAKDTEKANAPLVNQFGAADYLPLFDGALPASCQLQGTLFPTIKKAVEDTWIFGYLSTLLEFTHEPDFMGTIRIIQGGSFRVIFARLEDVLPLVMKDLHLRNQAGERAHQIDMATSQMFMKLTTMEQIKELAKKAKCITGVVDATSRSCVLVTPPGYMVGVIGLNDCHTVGARRSFLIKTERTKAVENVCNVCYLRLLRSRVG